MYPPSRGMISRLPWLAEWMADFSRMSGKSVTARTSMTPQDRFIGSPTSSRPMAVRMLLRAPSQPITYLDRMMEVSAVSWPRSRCRNVSVTG